MIFTLGLAAMAVAQTNPKRPNIVIIYADDLGYGDTALYGAKTVRTPNIKRLAREGLVFSDAHSTAATCTPSRYSLMTGSYPFRKKGVSVLPGNAALIVPTDRATLPSILRRAGYTTGIVGKWHLGIGSKTGTQDWNKTVAHGPNEIGFDYSFIMAATGDRVPCVYLENEKVAGLEPSDPLEISYEKPFEGELLGKYEYDYLKMKPAFGHDQAVVDGISRIGYEKGGKAAEWRDEDRADIFTKKALAFIDSSKRHPFFLYFATHDIHVPRVPAPRFVGKTAMGSRGDVIVEFDWTVGAVLHELDRLNLRKNTLILLSSNNGPVLNDGYQDRAEELVGKHKPAGPYRGGKYSIFEGGTRMPLVVSWPGHVTPGTSLALVNQVDFLASLASLVGQPLKPIDAPDSHNILPTLLGRNAVGLESTVEAAETRALRQGNWKYIEPSNFQSVDAETKQELGNSKEAQLYDLSSDPGERHNIAADHPDIVARLASTLQSIVEAGHSRQGALPVSSAAEMPLGVATLHTKTSMAWVPGGTFKMGDSSSQLPDAEPVHPVKIDGFYMDRNLVTNNEFAAFVKATDYLTVAEQKPVPAELPGVPKDKLLAGAVVFSPPIHPVVLDDPTRWWKFVPGANWRHPQGPASSLKGLGNYPVVQVCYEDAAAYARWAGKRLPTEAEFEYAARGGLTGKPYTWGDRYQPGMANTFQGNFPCCETSKPGPTPVGSFPANGFGLNDMAGNLWEWCQDWYRPGYPECAEVNPHGPSASYDPQEPNVPKRVLRGGSYLCSAEYCAGYMAAGRSKEGERTGASNIGFRCVSTIATGTAKNIR